MKRQIRKWVVRSWTAEDIPHITACHKAAYPDYPEDGGHYTARSYRLQFEAFPEGQYLVEYQGQIVAYATSIVVQLPESGYYKYSEITGSGSFSSHTPAGDSLYGADIAVHPAFRGRGLTKLLYKERVRLMKRYNLRRMIAHGRIPGYANHAGEMSAHEYVEAVVRGELTDSALNTHLSAGYTVRDVMMDAVWDDASLNYATFLEMSNPDFKPQKRKIAAVPLSRPNRKIRVCAAQYQMRVIKSWQEFEHSVAFFVNAADSYHCHFLVFPEYFTAQLFTLMPTEWSPKKTVGELANMTDRYIEMFCRMSSKHRLYIIGGSQPVWRDGKLFNVAHIFTPTGKVYTQDKLHVTPSERSAWDIRPGQGLTVFDTPLGRIAIQICYDIEFPELARLLTLAGVETIFVPFSTDERKAYLRVRYSAQARAVENSIYTVIAGNVGTLPHRSYLLNYGQAAVFTPSDFEFPPNAIAGEAEPNAETVVIADLDLTNLTVNREQGHTRPLYDRRIDMYELRSKVPIKLVHIE